MIVKKKDVEKFVGITPSEYNKLGDRHRKALEIFLRNISKYNFKKILDIGCGDGNFTVLIGRACNANEVYGVEISETGVKMAEKKGIKAIKLNVDEENLPFKDEYFDAVFAGEIIEHLYDPDHLLDEVYRVPKQNGLFVVTTPNLASIHNRIALLLGYQPYNMSVSTRYLVGYLKYSHDYSVVDHIRHFTLRSLEELLKKHGFSVIEKKGCGVLESWDKRYPKFLYLIDRFFSRFPSLSYTLLVVAQKRGREK